MYRTTTGGASRCTAWRETEQLSFPNRSAWPRPLIPRRSTGWPLVIGTEGRASHVRGMRDGHSDIFEGLDFWAPNANIFRDPRWGRGQETYGEDPFLTARLGVAFVTGLQGDDPKYYRVIST